MTTENYLSDLIQQQKNLASNLSSMGVEANETELLNSLVPKVLNIPKGEIVEINAVSGSFTPIADTTEILITDLPFTPVRFSIQAIDSFTSLNTPTKSVGYIINGHFDSTGAMYVARLNAIVNGSGTAQQTNMGIAKTQYENVNNPMYDKIGCGANSFHIKSLGATAYTFNFKAGVTYYWTASSGAAIEIAKIPREIWTITLTDGSVVEKEVALL